MHASVITGYRATSTLAPRRRTSGINTNAVQVAHPTCMLGMAAYWFETYFIPSLPKEIHPP